MECRRRKCLSMMTEHETLYWLSGGTQDLTGAHVKDIVYNKERNTTEDAMREHRN